MDHLFYAVCPDLESGLLAHDGSPLAHWFNESGRALGAPIQLVTTHPEGAERVPARSLVERIQLHGEPLTVRDLYAALAIQLPQAFPEFVLNASAGTATILVPRTLSAVELDRLENAFNGFGFEMKLTVSVDPTRFVEPRPFRTRIPTNGDISLMPSRHNRSCYPKHLMRIWEEDEDFWVGNRVRIFTEDWRDPARCLPGNFNKQTSRCMVNSAVFAPRNMRTYLCLFDRTALVMPLASHFPMALGALRVSEKELLELATRKRVEFLLPQSIDRYPVSFVQKLAEAAPGALLMSRRLAAATVVDARRRAPILYPSLEIDQRRRLLEMMYLTSTSALTRALCRELGQIWISSEYQLHSRGAMATPSLGFAPILAAIFKEATGKETFIELYSAGGSVEWASAIRATLFPIQTETFSEQAACELYASLYSGIQDDPTPVTYGGTETVVGDLLSLDDDAPIMEVEEAFSTADLDRLGEVIRKIGDSSLNSTTLRAAIDEMNERVHAFEKRSEYLERLDLLTLVGAVSAAAFGDQTAVRLLPIGAWVAQYILLKADPSLDPGGRLLDWARGINAWTTGDIVLVSRLKKKLQ